MYSSHPIQYKEDKLSQDITNPALRVSDFIMERKNPKVKEQVGLDGLQSIPSETKETKLKIVAWNPRALNTHSKCRFALELNGNITMLQEVWNPQSVLLGSLPFYDLCVRHEGNGGGSLLCIDQELFTIHKIFALNNDSKLYRLICHGNKILWVANIYLSKGLTSQLSHVFNEMIKNVPSEEYPLIVMGGDWNINVKNLEDPKTKLLFVLAKQLRLQVVFPQGHTRFLSTLDFLLLGSSLKCNSLSASASLSDHQALTLELTIPFPIHGRPLTVPNLKLASELTTRALKDSYNSLSFLQNIGASLSQNGHRIYNKMKKAKFQNSLLDKLLQLSSDEDIDSLVEKHYKYLIQDNEDQRFSPFSGPAFAFLKRFTKLNSKKIVSSIVDENGVVISEPETVSKHLIKTLMEIQFNPSYPLYDEPTDFPKFPVLDSAECEDILRQVSYGKAIALDLMSDVLLNSSGSGSKKTKNTF